MAYYFVAVAGLTVLTGLNGQISLGHGALMAVGAYTAAKLLARRDRSAACARAARGHGGRCGRRGSCRRGGRAPGGPYLAGATLALAVGLPAIADRFPSSSAASNG